MRSPIARSRGPQSTFTMLNLYQRTTPIDAPTTCLPTPQISYGTRGLYERFYRDCVANIGAWLDQRQAD
jgi:hypothetical protein